MNWQKRFPTSKKSNKSARAPIVTQRAPRKQLASKPTRKSAPATGGIKNFALYHPDRIHQKDHQMNVPLIPPKIPLPPDQIPMDTLSQPKYPTLIAFGNAINAIKVVGQKCVSAIKFLNTRVHGNENYIDELEIKVLHLETDMQELKRNYNRLQVYVHTEINSLENDQYDNLMVCENNMNNIENKLNESIDLVDR
eukprot:290209_1